MIEAGAGAMVGLLQGKECRIGRVVLLLLFSLTAAAVIVASPRSLALVPSHLDGTTLTLLLLYGSEKVNRSQTRRR